MYTVEGCRVVSLDMMGCHFHHCGKGSGGGVFFLVTIIEMFFSILNKNVNLTEKMTGNVYFQEKYIQGAICLKASYKTV